MRVEDFLRLFEASGVSLKGIYEKYDSCMAADGEKIRFARWLLRELQEQT